MCVTQTPVDRLLSVQVPEAVIVLLGMKCPKTNYPHRIHMVVPVSAFDIKC